MHKMFFFYIWFSFPFFSLCNWEFCIILQWSMEKRTHTPPKDSHIHPRLHAESGIKIKKKARNKNSTFLCFTFAIQSNTLSYIFSGIQLENKSQIESVFKLKKNANNILLLFLCFSKWANYLIYWNFYFEVYSA